MSHLLFDLLIFYGGWLFSQLLFNGYEAHLPLKQRVSKLLVISLIFAPIYYWGSRTLFYTILAIMGAGILFLHLYFFQHKHGIHWRTAEPRQLYLLLIGAIDPPDEE